MVAGCALTLAAVLPVVLAGPAAATFGGRNGRIAFNACGETGCDIYTVNPDGTAPQQVTHDGASLMPDWSPDGKRIAYASAVSGAVAIWIADPDGGNARQLTPDEADAANLWPRFMPDGKTILYVNCLGQDCDGGISAINVDGSGQHAITPNSGDSYNLADPSPDGRRITFMRWHVRGVKMGIYQLRLGADPRRQHGLTPPGLEAWAPDWSPDGETILISSNVFGNRPNGAIYALGRDESSNGPGESDIEQLTHPPFPLADWSASYSPGGDRIVFASDRLHPRRDGSDLFTMRADGGQVGPIPLPPAFAGLFAGWPRWGTAALEPADTASVPAAPAVPAPQAASALRALCAALAPPRGADRCRRMQIPGGG